MSIPATVLTSFLTSAVVSAIVAAVSKFYFDRMLLKLDHRYQLELAKAKQDIELSYDSLLELDRKKRETLPIIVERTYRIRNLCRDLLEEAELSQDDLPPLRTELGELERNLFVNRVVLDMSGILKMAHDYKRDVEVFIRYAADKLAADSEVIAQEMDENMSEGYKRIDKCYGDMTERIVVLLGGDHK